MTNYLIFTENTAEHYFFKNGIYVKRQSEKGIWQEAAPIFQGGRDGFGLFCSKDKSVHIICTDHENKLIYIVLNGSEQKKYVLSKLSRDISVSDMRLYNVRGRLNLIYSALYNGENLLIHCILGDHAKPYAIDATETPHFFIRKNRIYYTRTDGVFGFTDISDEKPGVFNPVYEDAHFGSVVNINGKERILFSRNSSIFLDGKELARDSHIEMPIFVDARGNFYIMWKNGGFVRYIVSRNGTDFDRPMRFMTSGKPIGIYTVQKNEEFTDFYGYDSGNGPVLLGNPEIFKVGYASAPQSELERVRAMLNKTQQDLIDAKKEIARLGKAIGSLSKE